MTLLLARLSERRRRRQLRRVARLLMELEAVGVRPRHVRPTFRATVR